MLLQLGTLESPDWGGGGGAQGRKWGGGSSGERQTQPCPRQILGEGTPLSIIIIVFLLASGMPREATTIWRVGLHTMQRRRCTLLPCPKARGSSAAGAAVAHPPSRRAPHAAVTPLPQDPRENKLVAGPRPRRAQLTQIPQPVCGCKGRQPSRPGSGLACVCVGKGATAPGAMTLVLADGPRKGETGTLPPAGACGNGKGRLGRLCNNNWSQKRWNSEAWIGPGLWIGLWDGPEQPSRMSMGRSGTAL
eukprot:gene25326-biopygen11987